MDRDDALRTSCRLSLDVLCAQFGADLPYRGGLDRGFPYRGERVPFLAPAKGIFRARAQRGAAALSLNTSVNSPYDDLVLDDGFEYAYRSGSPDQHDNRALRAAFELQVPLVYFVGTRPGRYRPVYPVFITHDDRLGGRVVISPGAMIGPLDEQEAVVIASSVERRYAVRNVRARLHQARFRGIVLPAYGDRCTICRLKETRLLDAAHYRRRRATGGRSDGHERTQPLLDPPPRVRREPRRRVARLPGACVAPALGGGRRADVGCPQDVRSAIDPSPGTPGSLSRPRASGNAFRTLRLTGASAGGHASYSSPGAANR